MAEPAGIPDAAGFDELEARRQRRNTAPAEPVPGGPGAEVIPILAWRSRSEQRTRLLNRIQEMLRPD